MSQGTAFDFRPCKNSAEGNIKQHFHKVDLTSIMTPRQSFFLGKIDVAYLYVQ